MFDDAGRFVGYHGTASDITLRIEAEERRHLAYHDTLTACRTGACSPTGSTRPYAMLPATGTGSHCC